MRRLLIFLVVAAIVGAVAASAAALSVTSQKLTSGTFQLTGFRDCTANAADTGGDGDGYEQNAAGSGISPSGACGDGGNVAEDKNSGSGGFSDAQAVCSSPQKDRHRFYNYGFTLPSDSEIKGIEVQLDARVDSITGTTLVFLCAELSWNGGTSWTATKQTNNLGTTETSIVLGSTNDTWGRTWSPTEFSDANFRVRITDVANSNRDFFLDRVAVRVTYR